MKLGIFFFVMYMTAFPSGPNSTLKVEPLVVHFASLTRCDIQRAKVVKKVIGLPAAVTECKAVILYDVEDL